MHNSATLVYPCRPKSENLGVTGKDQGRPKSGEPECDLRNRESRSQCNITIKSEKMKASSSLSLKQTVKKTLEEEVKFIRSKRSMSAWFDIRTGKTFKQKVYVTKGFSKELCKRLIAECEKTAAINMKQKDECSVLSNILGSRNTKFNTEGWFTDRHLFHPTTDLGIEMLHNETIKNEVNAELQKLIKQAANIYSMRENRITASDVFVVKYSCNTSDGQKELGEHVDGSEITFNIQLNCPTEYTGGGTLLGDPFGNDNNAIRLDQGRMLCHAGRQKHSGIRINSGVRYILVAFLSISETENAEPCGCCIVQ